MALLFIQISGTVAIGSPTMCAGTDVDQIKHATERKTSRAAGRYFSNCTSVRTHDVGRSTAYHSHEHWDMS